MADQINSVSDNQRRPLQLFVKLLNGETLSLQFPTPFIEARSVKHRIHQITKIPVPIQRLISGHQLKDDSVILHSDSTLSLSLRLLGGKGGFGSLLRGAATKAGQKKTNNFEACRDMSGRRLRHVNAERRLEEWKAEEEERRLEKIAEDFIKKKAKNGKKGVGDGEATKYVEKYREQSAKCVAVVEESVREAFKNAKRKALSDGADAKRLKIWMGKRKLDEHMDGDSSEDEDDEKTEKSVVLNNGYYSDSNKGTEGSQGSVTGGAQERDFSGGKSAESGSEEEKEILAWQGLESSKKDVSCVDNTVIGSDFRKQKVAQSSCGSYTEPDVVTGTETLHAERLESNESATENKEEVGALPKCVSSVENGILESQLINAEVNSSPDSKPGVDEETVTARANIVESDKPLNFDEFNSAEEMEVCFSCYANAVLQSLAFTRPLTSYLVRGLHSRACRKKDWCFVCEFERLILKAKEGESLLSPIRILSKIQKIGSHLARGKEEDAHEFLRYAVDAMQSVCLKEAGAGGPLAEETTLVGLTFGGYLRSKIKCMNCLGKSERCERMMDLTVEIDGNIGSLDEALAQFTGTEILDADNKYHCSRCKSYVKAKKKLTVLEAPNILTIVLKRFQSGNFGKLNKSIRFPEVLNMGPYMSRTSDKSPVYNLYAVVVHLDVMNTAFSGHYVCYVKDFRGEWFRIDDSTVIPVELERVLLEGAYMLLYARRSPRAPTLVKNALESHVVSSNKRDQGAVSSSSKMRVDSYISNADPPKAQQKHGKHSTSKQLSYSEDWGFHPPRRIPSADSWSGSSSLFSSSDTSSCSTTSTKDSVRSEDFSDYLFGEMGAEWYS